MRKYVVLCGHDHYNVLGIVRTLGEAGIDPILVTVDRPPRLAMKSRYVNVIHTVDSIHDGIELIRKLYTPTSRDPEKTFIIAAGDDATTVILDSMYDDLYGDFFFYNARGDMKKILDKVYQSEVAEKYGFKPLKTWRVNPQQHEVPYDIRYPVIIKAPNSYGSEWKEIMFVCHNELELNRAYFKIKSDEVLLQEYVDKVDEQSYNGISTEHGREVTILHKNTQVYNVEGHYTPRWNIMQPDDSDQKVITKLKKIIKDFGFEGIFEFEFIVDKNGDLRLLEVNLRNTVLGYASTVYGLPVVTLWCSAMTDGMSHVRGLKRKADPNLKDIVAIAECYDYDLFKQRLTPCRSRRQWKRMYKLCQAKLYRGRGDDNRPFVSFMIYKLFHKV